MHKENYDAYLHEVCIARMDCLYISLYKYMKPCD